MKCVPVVAVLLIAVTVAVSNASAHLHNIRSSGQISEIGYSLLKPLKKTSLDPTTVSRGLLINELFTNYDKRNYPSNFTLKHGLTIKSIDVDKSQNQFLVDAWVNEQWYDPRLIWAPESYGGVSSLSITPDLLWKPDMTVYNSASVRKPSCQEKNLVIKPNGAVINIVPCQFKVYCNLTLGQNPLEEQNCSLKIGSLTLDGYAMDVQFLMQVPSADLSSFENTTEYRITGNKAVRLSTIYECCSELYLDLRYDLSFQRKTNLPVVTCMKGMKKC